MKIALQCGRVLALILAICLAHQPLAASPRLTPLTIETMGEGKAHFRVEVAETPEALAQGLMHRKALAADEGMLFLFPSPRVARMWMKDTLIPLDMFFIGPDGRIADIRVRAEPMSEYVIASREPVIAVLEVPGGSLERLKILPGARVTHARLP